MQGECDVPRYCPAGSDVVDCVEGGACAATGCPLAWVNDGECDLVCYNSQCTDEDEDCEDWFCERDGEGTIHCVEVHSPDDSCLWANDGAKTDFNEPHLYKTTQLSR